MNALRDPETAPQLAKDASACERPVGLVLVGVNFGAKIARQLAQTAGPVRVTGVCDLELERARELAAELGVPVYPTLEEVLSDPTVEAVGVFTGPVGRGRLVERIVSAGKHVMTTKPFELDLNGAKAAFAAAAAHGRVLYLNSPSPVPAGDLAWMRSRLAEGRLGRVVAMRAQTWADYRERADGSWLDDPVRCPGGPLFRLGVYFLNDFGALPGRPLEVQVMQSRLRTGRPTADNAQISIRYEGGALGSVFTSFCVGDGQPYRDEVVLVCEHGTFRRWMERTGSVDMHEDHAVVELWRPGRAVERLVTVPGDYAGWYNWTAFHRAVRGGPGAISSGEMDTLAGVRLLDAMFRACASGVAEKVDGETE